MRWSRVAADAIVVFHAGYVSFVVFGLAAIVLGLAWRRRWARNFWFRVVHLGMILVVVAEALAGVPCPLTSWERALRVRAGQAAYPGDFLGYWAHRLIFVDAPPWAFTAAYAAFAATVVLTFVLAPPRWPGRPPHGSGPGPGMADTGFKIQDMGS